MSEDMPLPSSLKEQANLLSENVAVIEGRLLAGVNFRFGINKTVDGEPFRFSCDRATNNCWRIWVSRGKEQCVPVTDGSLAEKVAFISSLNELLCAKQGRMQKLANDIEIANSKALAFLAHHGPKQ